MRAFLRLACCCLISLPASPLLARGVELMPQAGARFGGTLTNEARNRDVSLDAKVAFGLAVDVALAGEGRFVRLSWSRERARVELIDPAEPGRRVTIDHLHFGGVYRPPRQRVEPYVFAGVGLSAIDVGGTRIFPSGSLGGGARWPLHERAALRLEGRGLMTLERGSGSLRCGNGCDLRLSGDGLFQAEILAGLSFGF